MRALHILFVSAGINAALAVVLLWPHPQTALPAAPPPVVIPGSNTVKTHVVLRKQFFSWDELESTDYPTYVTNLRNIGCPEPTIRDIIVADVNTLYLRKRTKDVVLADHEWWRTTPDTNLLQKAAAKIRALDDERRSLLTTLLGPGWDAPEAKPTNTETTLTGPLLGDLSPEVKKSVHEIIARSQQRAKDYLAAQARVGTAPDPVELAQFRKQARADLAGVLTPAQLEEYLLRYSQTAITLRAQLRGMDFSPDQFRSLFKTFDPIEQQMELTEPANTTQLAALQKQAETAMKSVLGTEWSGAAQQAQDPAYLSAVAFAQKAGAPADKIPALYQLNQALQAEQDRIRNDPTLTAEQQADQLKKAQAELEAARNILLGVPPDASAAAALAGAQNPPFPPGAGPAQIHNYSPGETVNQIAAQYGVTTTAIMNANPTLDFNGLQRGTPIRIPVSQ